MLLIIIFMRNFNSLQYGFLAQNKLLCVRDESRIARETGLYTRSCPGAPRTNPWKPVQMATLAIQLPVSLRSWNKVVLSQDAGGCVASLPRLACLSATPTG